MEWGTVHSFQDHSIVSPWSMAIILGWKPLSVTKALKDKRRFTITVNGVQRTLSLQNEFYGISYC